MSEAPRHGAIVALGLGTAVAMWDLAFAARLPALQLSGPLVLGLLGATLLAGGALGGRLIGGAKAGAAVGATAQLVNLLVLGAFLGERSAAAALIWVPGSIAIGAALGGIGSLLARRSADEVDWNAALGLSTIAAIVSVVVVGGLVTGFEVGMAVPDWPQTFGWTMFLYPMSKMTGGIYYEHGHRLMGSLVGLSVVLFALHLWRRDDRPGIRRFGVLALALVIVQGILGGYRVRLGALGLQVFHIKVAHGVLAQAVLATVTVLTAAVDRRWRDVTLPRRASHGDAAFARAAFGVLLLQVALGAIQRHHPNDNSGWLWVHIFWALPAAMAAVTLGGRAIAAAPAQLPGPLRLGGRALVVLTGVQLLLGFAALIAIRLPRVGDVPNATEVAVTTLHQTTGALLLASAAWTAAWLHRLRASSDWSPGSSFSKGSPE